MRRLLIANRGEIACRIARSARAEGWSPVMIYTDVDRNALHVAAGDVALYLGEEGHGSPYLQIPRVIEAALAAGCEAVHPGFGFLSERAEFAEAVLDADLRWVGPPPAVMRALGRKDAAKVLARQLGVPVVPGREASADGNTDWVALAEEVGFPLLIKAVAGGGGRGMRVVESAAQLNEQLALAGREARESFGDGALLLERYIARGRHLEVQVLADKHGNVLHLFERECSIQRRHQKIIEEAPSPALSLAQREAMTEAAVQLARGVGYQSAGTVEFLLDDTTGAFYFLEVNTRIQVEHPVTELVTGLDLVALQLRVALDEPLGLRQDDIALQGHAMEVRLCAEDPQADFLPQAGEVLHWAPPAGEGIRVDHGLLPRDHVPLHYDAMVAKIIAHGPSREVACARLQGALQRTRFVGLTCNLGYLRQVLAEPEFRTGRLSTRYVQEHPPLAPQPLADDVLVTAALFLHGHGLQGRLRNNPSRPDITVLTPAGGEPLYVALQPLRDGRFLFGIDRLPDPLLSRVPACDTPAVLIGTSQSSSGHGCVEVQIGGTRRRLDVLQHGADLWLTGSDGQTVQLREGTLLPEPQRQASSSGSVTAPGAAVVVTVAVQPGDEVAEGAVLVTMEAMKMLTVLRAPRAGTVAAVYARVGDSVAAGQVLVELVAPDAGS